jgi:hypothetical protein
MNTKCTSSSSKHVMKWKKSGVKFSLSAMKYVNKIIEIRESHHYELKNTSRLLFIAYKFVGMLKYWFAYD